MRPKLGIGTGIGIGNLGRRRDSGISLARDIVTNGVLADWVSFSRTTTATHVGSDGLIQTAAINEPRIDYDPVTLQLRGVLIEEARTNLVRRSQEFNVSPWNNVNTTVTPNATVSPDGTSNAYLMTRATSGSASYTNQAPGSVVSTGNQVAFSVYAKQADIGNRFAMRIQSSYPDRADAVFDLSNGDVIGTHVNDYTLVDAYTEDAGNGWYRCVLIAIPTATNVSALVFGPTDSSRAVGGWEASTPINEAYVWGAQAEITIHKPSSYIPTTSANVTRALDNTYTEGIDTYLNFNQTEGSLFLEAEETPNLASFWRYVAFSEVGVSLGVKEIAMYSYGVGHTVGFLIQDSSVTVTALATVVPDDAMFKSACGWKENDCIVYNNGGSGSTDSSNTVPTGINRIEIGRGNSQYVNTRIKNLTYYPKRLSNSQLQDLSA